MLLARFHRLPEGRHVRLRFARSRDRTALLELLAQLGLTADELELRRVLRCVPGRCLTVCATAYEGTQERLVGLGTMALPARDETLLAADPAVAALLDAALRENAGAWSRQVA